MSDTILSGRWVVYYGAENRQKRIVRDTAVTPTVTDTVNGLYSALQDLFDELNQMDDGVPMSAQTPTEYTIGIIDAGDKDPWFIDRTSVEYLTGGALKTASWDRVTGTNTGIVRFEYTASTADFVASDIGKTVIHASGDTGTLLDYNTTVSPKVCWIRPTSNAAANDWDTGSGTFTVTGGTGSVTQASAPISSGESLWANIYSIGTIETFTHIYIYQNSASLVAYKASTDWWGDGHIDILVNVKELGTETDEGYISVLARQYSKTYSYYTVDLTNGGRNPIPLQTGNDLDNQTGFWQMDLVTSSGTFVDGEEIRDDSDSTIRGVVTSWEGTNKIIEYYLIGDPQTNFGAGTGAFTGLTSSATGTAVAPTAVGPAAGTLPIARHGTSATRLASSDGGDFDVDENGTFENYSIVIDCNQQTLARVYEWSKYVTRRGETAQDVETDGMNGEAYIGTDYKLFYTSLTGTVSDGVVITQTGGAGAGAKGTVVHHNVTDKIVTLRNSRGTFSADGTTGSVYVGVDGSNKVIMNSGTSTATAVTPITAAPFGTFAGGKFFCAPGVVLDDYLTADLNNFQLVDDNGTVRVAPTKVNVTVNNTKTGDKIAVFRLTAEGGDIEKTYYSATAHSIGDATLLVGETIRVDEPGKSSGGVLRLVDTSANQEYRIRFSSWATSTFTLANQTGTMDDIGTTTTSTNLNDDGKAFLTTVKVGDLVLNTTRSNAVSYVTAVVSNNQLTISPAITGQVAGDAYEINAIPVATTTSDDVYVPFIDAYETADGSESVQIVYNATVYTRVRARRSGALSLRIIPFEQDSSITTSGMTVSVIRTLDTIVT